MTKDHAMNILGISHSASIKTAEQAYCQKRQHLQIRMVPGNPCLERRKAQTELAELTMAWKMFSNGKSTENKNPTPRTAAKQYPARRTAAYASTQNLGSLWNDFLDLLPIPKPVAIALILAMFFSVIISLLKNL
ncbi:MAG: hypothetical protein WC770_03890 [Phycisphaerae bacterium]|jgi:hypothetical protein